MQKESLSSVNNKAVLSVAEAMEALDLSRQTIYNEINAKRLRSFKLGRRRLIPADGIPEWVSMMERQVA
ncbi:MAG TPA: helix-turn-helix domain-containing protein [Chromatiaceae bacterium]|nr:helix-turn-helix domain-containing protein [Chromatiaceae bacterium]